MSETEITYLYEDDRARQVRALLLVLEAAGQGAGPPGDGAAARGWSPRAARVVPPAAEQEYHGAVYAPIEPGDQGRGGAP
jgi:hypothetical protein